MSLQLRIIVIGRRDKSLPLVFESDRSYFELYINARYYAQHPAMKSVYDQSVIDGKLFSSYRTVFVLAQEYSDSKTSDLNNCPSNKALVQKEALTICQDIGCSHNFCMCSIIIISFRKVHTSVLRYWLTREEHPSMGGKTLPLLPHSQYICCRYIIEDWENLQPYR